MGTVTGISDVDLVGWKNSQWRNLQVGWDESTVGERRNRVSIWEIEPVATPFYICPPPFFRPKLAKPGMLGDENNIENSFRQAMPWLGDSINVKDAQNPLLSMNLIQWMNMQHNPQLMASASQSPFFSSMMASLLQNNIGTDDHSKLLSFQTHTVPRPANSHFNSPKPTQVQQATPLIWSQLQQQSPHILPMPQQQQQVVIQSPQNLQQATVFSKQQLPQPILNTQQQLQAIQSQPQQESRQINVHPKQLTPVLQHQQITIHQPLVQQKQITSPTHPSLQLQAIPLDHVSFLQQRQLQDQLQQQPQPPQLRPDAASTGIVEQTKVQTFSIQRPQPQGQLKPVVTSGSGMQQIPNCANIGNLQQTTVPHNLQFQQQVELQHGLLQKPQQQQLQTTQGQSQLHLLQTLQQQQQQQHILSQLSPQVLSQLTQSQVTLQQNQLSQQKPLAQQPPGSGLSLPEPLDDVLMSTNQFSNLNKSQPATLPNPETLKYSTSPYNSFRISSGNLLSRSQLGRAMLPGGVVISGNNVVQELQCRTDTPVMTGMPCSKELDNRSFRNAMADQLEASSSATSFCMDKRGDESFSLPPVCLDGEVQADPRNNILVSNIDSIPPDTLLSSGFGSGKDLQNLLSGYGNQKDLDTEISTAAISSQSFGVADMSFKPGFLNDAVVNENVALNKGSRSNQPHRMRTYTKVQKRGSVGRSIDITRYRCYEDLRHDLACMFGINGQLEDPHRSDWKLVYVDNENDILLVGDDPWEEFVNCVQSIKILSAAEVQQMSLEGDLGRLPMQNEACSGSENGNIWRENSFGGAG